MKAQDEEVLRRSSIFRFLPDEHFEKLLAVREEAYEFGDLIVKQGDPANAFYVLISGRVRAVKFGSKRRGNRARTLRPGDSFGEAALAEGGTRNASVRCSTARSFCDWIARNFSS